MNQSEGLQDNQSQYFDDVAGILRQTLQIPDDRQLTTDTPLLGAMPEFDSMSVVTVLTVLEDQFGMLIDDDDVSAETFATLGTLLAFVRTKLDA